MVKLLQILLLAVSLPMLVNQSALGALLEEADNCETARTKLVEFSKNQDPTNLDKVMDSLGVDVLNTCDVAAGTVICIQCISENDELRALELFHDSKTKKVQFVGFGCGCK